MILAFLFSAALASQDDVAAARAAVEKCLPWLEKEGVAWIKQRDCLSCHQVTFMVWAHHEARAKGIAVDDRKLAEWTGWSLRESATQRVALLLTPAAVDGLKSDGLPAEVAAKLAPFTTKPELKGGLKEARFLKELGTALSPEELQEHQPAVLRRASRERGDGGGVDTMAQLLLAGVYGGDESREFVAATRAHLAGFQQPDGTWKPNGQLNGMNRAPGEATAITTMWSAIALGPTSDAATKAADAARKAAKGKTTEWLVARAILERTFGGPGADREFLKELLDRQKPDGGWSAVPEAASDAFATGLALYALGPADEAALRRARKFLVDTQSKDGSWPVPPAPWTKPGSKPERNKRLDPIYGYWGSAWAAIGLARTLPN
jgi:hypothetical protein